jgi:hypothetical protein
MDFFDTEKHIENNLLLLEKNAFKDVEKEERIIKEDLLFFKEKLKTIMWLKKNDKLQGQKKFDHMLELLSSMINSQLNILRTVFNLVGVEDNLLNKEELLLKKEHNLNKKFLDNERTVGHRKDLINSVKLADERLIKRYTQKLYGTSYDKEIKIFLNKLYRLLEEQKNFVSRKEIIELIRTIKDEEKLSTTIKNYDNKEYYLAKLGYKKSRKILSAAGIFSIARYGKEAFQQRLHYYNNGAPKWTEHTMLDTRL